MDCIDRISINSVPGYQMLNEFDWVGDFLKCQEIKQEILELRAQKREIKIVNPARADLLELVREQFAEYREKRVNYIQGYFRHNFKERSKGNIFNHLLYHSSSSTAWTPHVTLEEVEEAIEGLEEPEGTISENDRERELGLIEEKLAELRAELVELSPAIYFRLENGLAVDDIRETFFDHWRALQHRCNAPCGPRGILLHESPVDEVGAWRRLGLERAVNSQIKRSPNPGAR